MKVYKGSCASPGLVLGQVSRLEHHVETTTVGPFKPSRELQLLTDAIRTAQDELESMADRAAPSEQAIFQFQSMMLDDEGMMNEVRFCINAGIGAAAAMNQVGQRYADQLANMKDNPYMQLRSVDILDASRRVINIITNRPRMWLALDHPVILAAERLMPTDLFSVPSGMILGIITAEGSGQSHAAIIARAMNIPGIVQVGRDFLDDCDGRTVILDATGGQCTLDPDAAARQQAETRICELQRENEEMGQLHALPNRTKDGQPFELLANCFGPEDIDTAMQSGAQGVGLLRTGYMMLPGRILDEQEQYFFYCSCLAAAKGCPVTVRTFDFGSDRTISDAYQGLQSSKLGLRGIRNSLRQPHQFETQLCALLRAAARGPLRVMFPMVTNVEDWDAAMRVVERCREHLRERGVAFNEDTKFGVMLSVPAACLTAEDATATIKVGGVDTKVDPNDEIDKGTPVTLTADPAPEGQKFAVWFVKVNGVVQNDLRDLLTFPNEEDQTKAILKMPEGNVTVKAMYEVVDPVKPVDPVDPVDPVAPVAPVDPVLPGVIIGGAVILGAYETGTGIYRLMNMQGLPLPSNRIELAELVWERADKPEPQNMTDENLYADIDADDTDAQKAAHWMVEQELMKFDEDNNKFHPCFPVSKLRVCLTWQNAKDKGLID